MKTFLLSIFVLHAAFIRMRCFAQDTTSVAQDTNAIAQDVNLIQQGDNKKQTYPVIETFRNHQLINAQTVEMLQHGSFEFKIQHRFGEIGYDERFYKEFLGLAGSANIRVSLIFSLTSRLYAGIGWSKNKKIVDVESKLLLLRQTEENEIPVSVAVYFNAANRTDDFPKVPANAFFSDSVTPFVYKYDHRFSYNAQLIIARKFTERISFQITPAFIYKNLVDPGKQNHTLSLSAGGRYKLSDNRSIIFEYAYIADKEKVITSIEGAKPRDPVSIGFEIATSGHAFQIVMSSTNNIPEQEVYTNNSVDYLGNQGKTSFFLGFNIKRMLFYK